MGVYPDVPLEGARETRGNARTMLAAVDDPGAQRKAEKKAWAEADAPNVLAISSGNSVLKLTLP